MRPQPRLRAPPERANAGKGIRLRVVRGADRSYYEVEDPGALEAVRAGLCDAEFHAGLELRRLWRIGTLNGESTSSPVSRLGLGCSGFYQDAPDDGRGVAAARGAAQFASGIACTCSRDNGRCGQENCSGRRQYRAKHAYCVQASQTETRPRSAAMQSLTFPVNLSSIHA
jgi:hypothetical protein